MKTVIVKLGGSAITEKSDNKLAVRQDVVRRLGRELAYVKKRKGVRYIVVHGAGPFGHVPAKKYSIKDGYREKTQLKGVALTRQNMESLNSQVVSILNSSGLDSIGFQPSANVVTDGGRIRKFDQEALTGYLELGITPVLYGDVVTDRSLGFTVLSGDVIVPYLAQKHNCKKMIMVTLFDGIFDGDPSEGSCKRIPRITEKNLEILKGRKAKGTDVTGGIHSKVKELLRYSKKGYKSHIIGCGREKLKKALMGDKDVGTVIG